MIGLVMYCSCLDSDHVGSGFVSGASAVLFGGRDLVAGVGWFSFLTLDCEQQSSFEGNFWYVRSWV